MLTFFPFSLFLLWLKRSQIFQEGDFFPALEKILSEGTEDAVIPRYFFASLQQMERFVCDFSTKLIGLHFGEPPFPRHKGAFQL